MTSKNQKAQQRQEVTLSATKYSTGPQAGLNRRARRSLASSRMPEGGMRPHAIEAMERNVEAMDEAAKKAEASNG